MVHWLPMAALVALVGCTPDTGNDWRGGGDPSDDTGTSDPDDTSSCAPTVTEYDAHFEDYPNVGWVIEVTTGFEDHGCTIEGGTWKPLP